MADDTAKKPGAQTSDDPQEVTSDDAYNDLAFTGMSDAHAKAGNDMASEDDLLRPTQNPQADPLDDLDDSVGTNLPPDPDDIPVAASGEETVSGSAAALDSDDDVGGMMKRYTGQDPDPNMDNPQELGTAEEIDKDEEDIRTS